MYSILKYNLDLKETTEIESGTRKTWSVSLDLARNVSNRAKQVVFLLLSLVNLNLVALDPSAKSE